MRAVGLALVDPWRVGVRCIPHVVVGAQDAVRAGLVLRPVQDHESCALAGGPVHHQRIVIGQGDHDDVLGLLREIDAVVEELAEQREHAVVRRREAEVGGDVRDVERFALGHALVGQPVGVTGNGRGAVVDGSVGLAGGGNCRGV